MRERLQKLKIKISNFKLKDMLSFKNLPLRRDKAIESAPDSDINTSFPINENARKLHPNTQHMTVLGIIEHPDSGARTLVLRKADGTSAAWFRAGQYVSVKLRIGESLVSRPYSISSSPKDTEDGRLCITVKENPGGFVADYMLGKIKEGDSLLVSGPEGQFFHDNLRDSRNVIAVAGGSGITPFLSMAAAIRDGIEDFNLTILYGSRTESSILFRKELDEIASQTDKVKVIHILSEERRPGFENGFVTADLIRKHAPDDYSLFICGPAGLYRHMELVVSELGLPARKVRREIIGVSGKPVSAENESPDTYYDLTVIQGPETYCIKASSRETLLVAMERAGIAAPAKCRSGECGWCRSKVISGTYIVSEQNDYRRHMDKETDHIHPCVTFPDSDIVLEVPRVYN